MRLGLGLSLTRPGRLALLGAELSPNVAMNDTTGLSTSSATLASIISELHITLTATSGGAYFEIATTAGRSYQLTATARNVTSTNLQLRAYDGGGFVTMLSNDGYSGTTNKVLSANFTAISATSRIYMRVVGVSGNEAVFDSVSVKQFN